MSSEPKSLGTLYPSDPRFALGVEAQGNDTKQLPCIYNGTTDQHVYFAKQADLYDLDTYYNGDKLTFHQEDAMATPNYAAAYNDSTDRKMFIVFVIDKATNEVKTANVVAADRDEALFKVYRALDLQAFDYSNVDIRITTVTDLSPSTVSVG